MSASVAEIEGVIICHCGTFLLYGCTFNGVNVSLFTRMPGGVTVGDLGLFCCVPCLLTAVTSLCLSLLLIILILMIILMIMIICTFGAPSLKYIALSA